MVDIHQNVLRTWYYTQDWCPLHHAVLYRFLGVAVIHLNRRSVP